MKIVAPLLVTALASLMPLAASGQQASHLRLPSDVLDVVPPSEWARGEPGAMRVQPPECRSFPDEGLRRRIVDIAVQEWVFFGTPVLDRVNDARLLPPGVVSDPDRPVFEASTRRPPPLNAEESARVAASIAGYWAVTPEGASIVADQNRTWNRRGIDVRWRSPWSAAFVSWVMCEAGLGTAEEFRHAIAHRSYIDQSIRARDGAAPEAAYVAFDIGERTVEPGDLLCSGRRPRYRNIAERRRQLGTGASSHCDIVVDVDEREERILAIGGNVLRSVSLKVLPGEPSPDGLRPRAASRARLFAHLKLRADPIEGNALGRSRVLGALTCLGNGTSTARTVQVVAELAVEPAPVGRC